MAIKRGFLRASVCGAVLVQASLLTTIPNQAFAACGTGGQCSVTSGTVSNFSGGTYWATDFMVNSTPIGGPGQPALYAANPGSHINASNIVIQPRSGNFLGIRWQQGYNGYKAQAGNGGAINLTNATLTGGLNGLLAWGNDAHITMTGGSIHVGQNAATVRNTSSLIFNGGVAIAVTDIYSVGVDAYDEARVIFNDARVSATGYGSRAVRGNDRSDLSFTATDVRVAGDYANGIEAIDETNVNFTNGTVEASGENSRAVLGRNNATLTFDEAHIIASGTDGSIGIDVRDNAKMSFQNGTVEILPGNRGSFVVLAMDLADLTFDGTDIKAHNAFGQGIATYGNARVAFNDGTIEATNTQGWGILARYNSEVALNNAQITASGVQSNGIGVENNAKVSFNDGSIEASGLNSRGIVSEGQARLTLENATISATGNDAFGVVFDGAAGVPTTPGSVVNMLGGTIVASPQATAIKAQGGTFAHQLTIKNTVVEGGNRLIEAQDSSHLDFTAENSVLSGAAQIIGNNANLAINLQGSLWRLNHDTAGNGASSISSLDFTNSVLRFDAPVGGVLGTYQSLTIGAGLPSTADVYNIGAGSHVEINSFINNGGIWSNQYTDRLLIRGNVTGRTLLKINEMAGSTGASSSTRGTNAADEGISLVQVAGNAGPDSFYIEGDYLTLAGKPYVHRIYAFGPASAYGAADGGQSQVNSLSHWDYRLQNEFIRNSHGWAVQVVPQVASYLTAPTALFQAGFMDAGNLHHRLGELRQTQALEEGEQPTRMRGNFFLRGYGGDYNYHSDLSSIQYGYDADIRYKAVQAGGSLYGFDTANGQMMFGLAGSYGDLSFSPDRYDSRKTDMDVWSASAYASWLGTNGLHVDAILSYGGFSGSVSTKRYHHTASLKGNSLTASLEVGQNFALGSDGWSIEPQAQLIYQRLSFDRAHDIDDFAIVLGHPDQWVGRIGGKLSKQMTVESVERLEIYGKLNLTHGFGDGDSVFLGDNFHIGEFGTQIEGGLGFNLDMTKNASLYGDVSYQGRVGDGGSNGLSLNGGLRFQF